MSDTHRSSTVHLSEQECRAEGSFQYLLEKPCIGVTCQPPITSDNGLCLFVCGKEGFESIAKDIANARRSIDIIAWGFDPAMNLVRSEDGGWKRQNSYGQLLEDAAKRGVRVRLLVWYNYFGSSKVGNMPGYGGWGPSLKINEMYAMGGVAPPSVWNDMAGQRHDYCVEWYRRAFSKSINNLSILKRDGQKEAVKRGLHGEKNAPSTQGLIDEKLLMEQWGTHHQKTLLIDYRAPNTGIGYIMGLNSVTDYWDSAEHLLDDPRREPGGRSEITAGYRRMKPLQDYACRIDGGGVLKGVFDNFAKAWERAGGKPDPKLVEERIAPVGKSVLEPTPEEKEHVREMARQLARAPRRSRAQVLRTQCEEAEQSIKAFYFHTNTVARDYLYIENQYFFYPEWAEELKTARKAWVEDWQKKLPCTENPLVKGQVKARHMPILHLMVVIPEPELDEMVPRTYETMKHLGQEKTMRTQVRKADGSLEIDPATGKPKEVGQDVMIEDADARQRQYEQDVAEWRRDLKERSGSWRRLKPSIPPMPPDESDVVKDAKAIQSISTLGLEKKYGMKVSIAMLYTSGVMNGRMRYRPIYIHSKLMIHSDACFTLGSANINQRSMAADTEINIASDCPETVRALRERVFRLHSGGEVSGEGNWQDLTGERNPSPFGQWTRLMQRNRNRRDKSKESLKGFLLPFEEGRVCEKRYA